MDPKGNFHPNMHSLTSCGQVKLQEHSRVPAVSHTSVQWSPLSGRALVHAARGQHSTARGSDKLHNTSERMWTVYTVASAPPRRAHNHTRSVDCILSRRLCSTQRRQRHQSTARMQGAPPHTRYETPATCEIQAWHESAGSLCAARGARLQRGTARAGRGLRAHPVWCWSFLLFWSLTCQPCLLCWKGCCQSACSKSSPCGCV